MGRGGGCAYCPPAKHRHRTRQHRDNPVQWCHECHAHVCGKHVVWADNQWRCTRCARQNNQQHEGGP